MRLLGLYTTALLIPFLWVGATFVCADPAAPLPVAPFAPLPSPVPNPQPSPQPQPNAVTALGADQVLVESTPVLWQIAASPIGLVNVVEEAIPEGATIKYRGRFVGGNGQLQTRVFAGKYLYAIEPVAGASGRVELLIFSAGGKSSDVVRRTIDVGGSVPGPNPVPVPSDALLGAVQTEFTADTSPTKVADKSSLKEILLATAEATKLGSVRTAKNFFDVLHNSTDSRIKDRLSGIRKVIGSELNKVVAVKEGDVLSDQNRTDIAAQLKRFAMILDAVK